VADNRPLIQERKRYRTIVADPPWPYEEGFASLSRRRGGGRRPYDLPYEAMTVKEIAELPVVSLAATDVSGTTAKRTGRPHDGTRLFLWTTTKHIEAAYSVARSWGFTPGVLLVWCKSSPSGFGGIFAPNVEFVIVGSRGTPRPAIGSTPTRWFNWPRGQHSEKPDAFYDMVEQVSPGPYVELFARRARFGWDYWGDQSLGTAEMAA
jgi:N6-adenosine-specific RNA methylase IME4